LIDTDAGLRTKLSDAVLHDRTNPRTGIVPSLGFQPCGCGDKEGEEEFDHVLLKVRVKVLIRRILIKSGSVC
jgi:hypothetical protein